MKTRSMLLIGLFALAGALLSTTAANAQGFGVGGRVPGSYGNYGPFIFTPGGGNSFNTFYSGGASGMNPYGYPGYGYGSSYGMGYNPYGYSGYANPGYANPGYANPGYAGLNYYGGYSIPSLSSTLPPVSAYSSAYSMPNVYISSKLGQANTGSTVTVVKVKVPSPAADVWFGDYKAKQTGPVRDFVTPELQPGKKYKYIVRAVWKEKGETVERKETINFMPGETVTVDFTQPVMSEEAGKKAGTDKKDEKSPEKKAVKGNQ